MPTHLNFFFIHALLTLVLFGWESTIFFYSHYFKQKMIWIKLWRFHSVWIMLLETTPCPDRCTAWLLTKCLGNETKYLVRKQTSSDSPIQHSWLARQTGQLWTHLILHALSVCQQVFTVAMASSLTIQNICLHYHIFISYPISHIGKIIRNLLVIKSN